MDFQAKVSPPARVLGQIIRAARHRKGYAAQEVAEWVGVDFSEYTDFERGRVELSAEVLDHLKVLLGVNPSREWFHFAHIQRFSEDSRSAGGTEQEDPSPDAVDEAQVQREFQSILKALIDRLDELRQENERLKALLVKHVMTQESSGDETG